MPELLSGETMGAVRELIIRDIEASRVGGHVAVLADLGPCPITAEPCGRPQDRERRPHGRGPEGHDARLHSWKRDAAGRHG